MGWEAAERKPRPEAAVQKRRGGVADVIRSPGRQLDPAERGLAESRFGRDFSSVRLHADPAAAASARAVGTAAYTVGEHVAIDPDRVRTLPGGVGPVLDHELTHVAQQRSGAVPAGTLQRLPQEGGRRGSTLPYREAMEEYERARRVTPPGAQVTDERPVVDSANRPTVTRIVAFLDRADQAFQTLLAGRAPKGNAWVTAGNANIQTVLRLMSALRLDIDGGGIILRFDQGAGAVAAHYDEGQNTIHVPPIPDDNAMSRVFPSLLHEYAHAGQDRAAAAAIMQARAPREHTREDELRKETDARLVDVYAASLLTQAKLGPTKAEDAFAVIFETVGFRVDFERIRSGGRKERPAGAKAIRDRLEGPYERQLAQHAPGVRYPIEITQSNTARLTMHAPLSGTMDTDLGPIPASVKTVDALRNHLQYVLTSKGWFGRLFDSPRGTRYVLATFFVFFRGADGRDQLVLEFHMEPPAVWTPNTTGRTPPNVHIPP